MLSFLNKQRYFHVKTFIRLPKKWFYKKAGGHITTFAKDSTFSLLIKIIHPLEGEIHLSESASWLITCYSVCVHACVHTHTRLHSQKITVSLKEMLCFQSVLPTQIEHFLKQRRPSRYVAATDNGDKVITSELQETPWPQIRS